MANPSHPTMLASPSPAPQSRSLTLPDLAATARLAAALAAAVKPGDIVLLDGVVGVGKTTLARALIQALTTADQVVPSPTFTLVQEYELPPPLSGSADARLLHYDLYRLTDPEELLELGWEEVGSDAVIALIEWPNRLGAMPPGDVLHLQIEAQENSARRELTLHAYGDWGTRIGLLSV